MATGAHELSLAPSSLPRRKGSHMMQAGEGTSSPSSTRLARRQSLGYSFSAHSPTAAASFTSASFMSAEDSVMGAAALQTLGSAASSHQQIPSTRRCGREGDAAIAAVMDASRRAKLAFGLRESLREQCEAVKLRKADGSTGPHGKVWSSQLCGYHCVAHKAPCSRGV
jgi:hypothetical protein